jgi:hypothetical protein
MKPAPSILRPAAFSRVSPTTISPAKGRLDHSAIGLTKTAFQRRTQSVLDYLVGTLRKSW